MGRGDEEEVRDNGPTLTELLLGRDCKNDLATSDIADCFTENTSVKRLIVIGTKFGAEVSKITNILHQNTSLSFLHLWGNRISDKGPSSLADFLSENATLRTLDLEDNNNVSDAGAASMARALRENGTLTEVNLAKNNIRNVSQLSNALRLNNTITTLILDGNPIGDER